MIYVPAITKMRQPELLSISVSNTAQYVQPILNKRARLVIGSFAPLGSVNCRVFGGISLNDRLAA